jgi:hypothetical protein
VGARDNFEQIVDFFPEIREVVSEHDKAVDLVTERCEQLQRTLTQSRDLQETYQRATSPDSLKKIAEDFGIAGQYETPNSILKKLFGAYPESDHLNLLAQLIINNTGDLPAYFTSAPLWNRKKDEFSALLNCPGVRGSYRSLLKAGDSLAQWVAHLIRVLRETRLELSIKHDVPYVDLKEDNFEGVGS